MNALLLIMESTGFDRSLNSCANLLKFTEVVWLYLALFHPRVTYVKGPDKKFGKILLNVVAGECLTVSSRKLGQL